MKKIGVVTTDRSVWKIIWNRIEPVGGPLEWECAPALHFLTTIFGWKTRKSSTRRLHCVTTLTSYRNKWRLSTKSPQHFLKTVRGVWPATEKNGASVVEVRNILWKTVRGVSPASEKNGASVVKVRNILWKTVRGMSRATEKNGVSVVKVPNILWNNVGVVTTDRSFSNKLWNRIEPVGGPLACEMPLYFFKGFVCL